MRRTKLANSASGRPRKSWWRELELVGALEQHRQAIGRAERRRRTGRCRAVAASTASSAPANVGRRVDGEILVRARERVLDAVAHRGGGAGRAEHERAVGRDAAVGWARRATRRTSTSVLPVPGPADHEQRRAAVGDRVALRIGQPVEGARHRLPRVSANGVRARLRMRGRGAGRGRRHDAGADRIRGWSIPWQRRTGSRRAGGSPPSCARCSPRMPEHGASAPSSSARRGRRPHARDRPGRRGHDLRRARAPATRRAHASSRSPRSAARSTSAADRCAS